MNLMMLVSFVIVGILILCFSITLATTVILKKDIGLDPSVRSLVSECLNSPEAAKLPNKRCLYISHYYHENCTHVKCNVARFSSNDTLKYTRDDKRLFMIKAKEASPCAPNRQCVPSGTAQGMVIRSGKPVLKCTAKSNQSFPLSPPLSEWTESCRVEPCLLDSLTEDKETLDLLKNIHYGCGTDWPSKIEWCKDQMQKIIPSVQFFECQFTAERGSKYCAENDAQPLIQFSICRYCDPKRNETVAGSNSIGVYLKNIVCPEGDQLLTEKDACSYRCGKHAATALPAGRPCNVEMHTADVDHFYRILMAKLGLLIANHPLIVIMMSIVISSLATYPLLLGFKDYKKFVWTRAASIDLFTPSDSWSKSQKSGMENFFPDGGYFADRTVVSPSLFIVLVSAKSSTNVLRPEIVVEYANLRRKLESIVFLYNNTVYDYRTLCGGQNLDPFSAKCQQDSFILLYNLHKNLPQILPHLTYPYVRLLTSNSTSDFRTEFYIGPLFGGVKVDISRQNEILSAKYARMIFNLPNKIGNKTKRESKELLEQFSLKFMQILDEYESKNVSIYYWSATKYVQDMRLISRRIVRCLPYLIILLLIFALISCWMRDPVLSQPYLALCGVVSACLGIECGFTIGIDDTFVMLNVWRQTDSKLPIKSRLSRTFEEAGVSITITSLTDVASFLIGTTSVFPAVRIFCAFAACTLATMFAFQLTFFGAYQ
uniref:SSD domain-containing protein n=1 Tax=Romanomermis culicivorax TaxID=13658 RepID=A0A915LAQ6_ROMCU